MNIPRGLPGMLGGAQPAAPAPVTPHARKPKVFLQTQTKLLGTTVPPSPSVIYENEDGETRELTIYTSGQPVHSTTGLPARFVGLWVRVVWTRNGATFTQIHPGNKRITVVAARVEVTPFMRPIATATSPFPADALCTVLCTVTEGIDGESLVPSLWYPSTDPLNNPLGYRGQITPYPSLAQRFNGNGPLLWLRAQGYNAGATGRYLMFFDIDADPSGLPAGTLKPITACFVQPNGGTFSFDQSNSGYAVHQGLWWCVSSTADFLTADLAATFRVDGEIAALELQPAALQSGG